MFFEEVEKVGVCFDFVWNLDFSGVGFFLVIFFWGFEE